MAHSDGGNHVATHHLAEMGHNVEIHAWDREFEHPKSEIKSGYKIIRYRIGKKSNQ